MHQFFRRLAAPVLGLGERSKTRPQASFFMFERHYLPLPIFFAIFFAQLLISHLFRRSANPAPLHRVSALQCCLLRINFSQTKATPTVMLMMMTFQKKNLASAATPHDSSPQEATLAAWNDKMVENFDSSPPFLTSKTHRPLADRLIFRGLT